MKKNDVSKVDFADKIEKFSYMKPFTEQEMAEKRIDLAEKSIKYKGLKEELKKVKESYTVRMKPVNEEVQQLLTDLHYKAEFVTEECAVEFDHKKQIATYYNSEGIEVGKRPLTMDERQTSIFTESRKEGTND